MLGFAPSNGAGLLYNGCVAPEGLQVQFDVPLVTTPSGGSASTGLDISQEATGDAALQDFDPASVRFGSGADHHPSRSNVRFTPQSGQSADMLACPLSAKSDVTHCTKALLFDHL